MHTPADSPPYFYPSQTAWVQDDAPLKLAVKSRQVGFSYCNAYRLVKLVSVEDARLDAFISSRDLLQAKFQLEDCLHWARLLNIGATSNGELLLDPATNSSAYVLQFANGRRIYSLSSNPNALAGKRGHVTLDEFALHPDQRLLYSVALPVTTWGGQLSIFSTPRGSNCFFNELVTGARNGNPMGWSFHELPIQKAVAEGIVERINAKKGTNESPEVFLNRLRVQCPNQETWDREYCCIPSDESAAFFTYDLLDPCTDPTLILPTLDDFLKSMSSSLAAPQRSGGGLAAPERSAGGLAAPQHSGGGLAAPEPPTHHASRITSPELPTPHSALYIGVDVGRYHDLCVIDVGEKIGSVMVDRLRLELHDQPFAQIEAQLFPLLALPQLKRACIDKSSIGEHLAERARERFGWKIEPINFSLPMKEKLAFALRRDLEDRRLRIPADDKLRADLRGLRKETTPSGKITFLGETDDSHCDRTWAKALRQHASRPLPSAGAIFI